MTAEYRQIKIPFVSPKKDTNGIFSFIGLFRLNRMKIQIRFRKVRSAHDEHGAREARPDEGASLLCG